MDCLYIGQDVRRQKDLAAFRLIAVQVYNALAEKALQPHEYLSLPAVDGPARVVKPPGHTQWRQRMLEKYGDTLEA